MSKEILTKKNKEWAIIYEELEKKAIKIIINLQDEIEKLEDIIREKELTIEELEEKIKFMIELEEDVL
jgi:3-polyprenyl-4-hydroxybenzoate decarboxylase